MEMENSFYVVVKNIKKTSNNEDGAIFGERMSSGRDTSTFKTGGMEIWR